jgi:hypothetical protein
VRRQSVGVEDVHALAKLVKTQARTVDREVATLRRLAARLEQAARPTPLTETGEPRTPHREDTDHASSEAEDPALAMA